MPSILMQNNPFNIMVNYNEKMENKVLQDYQPAFTQLQGAIGDISLIEHFPCTVPPGHI